MFSELDATYIRKYIGYGAIFIQSEPRLDAAILAVQSVADKGTRPDSSTENYIKGLIYGTAAVSGTGVTPGGASTTGQTFAMPPIRGLLQIEAQIALLDTFMGALSADNMEAQVDSARETIRLRGEGRRLCHQMARILGLKGVRADVFSASPVISDEDPFAYEDAEHWRGGP